MCGEAQTAGVDGRFLVFSTYAQLVAAIPIRRRMCIAMTLRRGRSIVSRAAKRAHDANGNNDLFDATITDGNRGGRRARACDCSMK